MTPEHDYAIRRDHAEDESAPRATLVYIVALALAAWAAITLVWWALT